MKNAFKFGFLALAITLSVAACNSEKSGESTDTSLSDTATITTTVDTNITDSTVKDTAITVTKDTTKL
ncbi:MAG: hypothetical protein H7223_11440 [Pedobacter sp.]|uniref:hypothetical protein n=1 Tax=Pedobacter sp. JCM 36344 TaxID=3374280 RepID=UPI00198491B8|nr:hypothetical protein [Pedobacter sp.]